VKSVVANVVLHASITQRHTAAVAHLEAMGNPRITGGRRL
jgi:hypothetical protein